MTHIHEADDVDPQLEFGVAEVLRECALLVAVSQAAEAEPVHE